MYNGKFVNGCRKLGAELESVVGEEGEWAYPERDERVHKHIRGTFSCKFRDGDNEHVLVRGGVEEFPPTVVNRSPK